MATKTRFPLEEAEKVAVGLQELLRPACERIEVAGSIRRRKAEVSDIELVAVPHYEDGVDMFGDVVERIDFLQTAIMGLVENRVLKIRGGYGPQNKLMQHVPTGIPVDIFSATVENWGMAMLVRTGPADFNKAVMSRLQQLGHRGHAYGGITLNAVDIHGGRREITCPDEKDVFDVLGWEFIAPQERR